MLKWYADNSELSSDKTKPNVLLFGGVVVNEVSEKQIENLLREIKSKYTYPTLPIKWNFKDLEKTYQEFNRQSDYEKLKEKSFEWRREIFEKSLDIDYRVVLACMERHTSKIPISKIKEQLIEITFSQVLMRIGLFAKDQPFIDNFEIILDWPESSNPKPFNREYFRAYNIGQSVNKIKYHCGPLSKLGFNECLYYARSTHSSLLQFTDLIIGAAKDYIVKTIHGTDYSLGYDLTKLILKKYRGYPNKIIEYGMNFAPKTSSCYKTLKNEIENSVV